MDSTWSQTKLGLLTAGEAVAAKCSAAGIILLQLYSDAVSVGYKWDRGAPKIGPMDIELPFKNSSSDSSMKKKTRISLK